MKIIRKSNNDIIYEGHDWETFEKLCQDLIEQKRDKYYIGTIAGKEYEINVIFNNKYTS